MAKKITIAISKGGVGKTTVSSMLGFQFSKKGSKVLIVDLDPQSNTTRLFQNTFYKGESQDFTTLFEGLEAKDLSIAIHKINENLHLIPSSQNTVDFSRLLTEKSKYNFLRKYIEKIEGDYDYIFFYVPPTIFSDFLNNALAASDYFIILTETSNFSFEGIQDFYDAALRIHSTVNDSLDFLGVLINMREDDDEIFAELDERYNLGDKETYFTTVIPKRKRLAKYMSNGMYKRKIESAIEYDRWDKEIMSIFEELAEEVKTKTGGHIES